MKRCFVMFVFLVFMLLLAILLDNPQNWQEKDEVLVENKVKVENLVK